MDGNVRNKSVLLVLQYMMLQKKLIPWVACRGCSAPRADGAQLAQITRCALPAAAVEPTCVNPTFDATVSTYKKRVYCISVICFVL